MGFRGLSTSCPCLAQINQGRAHCSLCIQSSTACQQRESYTNACGQALARALLPDGPDGKPALRPAKHPAATLRAVEALVPELASMLEVHTGCMLKN